MRKQNDNSDIKTVLEYIAKLRGESVEALANSIFEEWLTDNYAENVDAAEQERGLPSTILVNRRGKYTRQSWRVMQSNLKQLAC